MSKPGIVQVLDFLDAPTPTEWFAAAPQHIDELLIDHANCEKKAASTAISLTYKYVDKPSVLRKMSRLAREELRHFELVLDMMDTMGVAYRHLGSASYARELHGAIRGNEPGRLVDSLICGAVVEARSCERFHGLIDVLPEPLGALYAQLLNSEARHFRDYLGLAREVGGAADVDQRLGVFLQRDAELINSPDPHFRFHSGLPVDLAPGCAAGCAEG